MGARAGHGELERSVVLTPGVTVTWDPARPQQCAALTVDGEDADARLVGVERGPWLRLAAVGVLDQCLYLPLDRALLDAEQATAQFTAARTLRTTEPARDALIGTALVGARHASRGVVAFLERLAAEDGTTPPLLASHLGRLARCYDELHDEVHGADVALAAVGAAWRRLTSIERVAGPRRPVTGQQAAPGTPRPGAGQIDPRTLPARVLRLGPTADAAEISVDPVRRCGSMAVRVRVDAFSARPALDEVIDVGVRLVDRRSGEVRGYGVLGRPATPRPGPQFEGVFALPEAVSLPDVRIDLFGPGRTPAGCGDLRPARRATLFLAAWRSLVADVRLWGSRIGPSARLRTIVEQVGGDADGALWAGGPSRSDLSFLAGSGDRELTGWLRGPSTPPPRRRGAAAVVASVCGPGDLLVAEVAAAVAS